MATLFAVRPLPEVEPPMNRAGVQASFAVPGTITPTLIYGEIEFGPVGFDTFFGFQLVQTTRDYLDPTDPNSNVTSYNTKASSVELQVDPNLKNGSFAFGNGTFEFVGISFSFDTLSIQNINFSPTYKLANFFGDMAGMTGTLMGLDTIKVAMGVPTAIFSCKAKSTLPLEDLFNG